MGLLLRHRRVQRKLRNFIRRWSLYTNLLKATKAVQKILALVGRHRERYGRDEEQAWGLLNVSPGERDTNELHQTHIDSDSAVEGAIKSIHVTTDEDEDWSASAAEFEVPQVPKSKLQDESEGTLEWWEKGMMACHFSLYLVYHAARSLHPKVYHEQHQS
jgi:hypothetical protein